jgi:uncharacterized protein (TIGR02444 family)
MREGVSAHCLHVQDTYGVDVNVLLMSLYAATCLGRAPNANDVGGIDALTSDYRQNVVIPLRTARRFLKDIGLGAVPESLRGDIKKSEVRAEQIQQGLLVRGLSALPERAAPAAQVARTVVEYFAALRKVPTVLDQDPAGLAAIAALAEAAEAAVDKAVSR